MRVGRTQEFLLVYYSAGLVVSHNTQQYTWDSGKSMATNSVNQGIKKSWSLLAFAKERGQMKVAPFKNSQTGEEFKSCAFVSPENTVTLVGFSSNLGELTPAEIVAQKNDLQVVELNSGTFKLCKASNSSWEDVSL